jgi:hypothetical protein
VPVILAAMAALAGALISPQPGSPQPDSVQPEVP